MWLPCRWFFILLFLLALGTPCAIYADEEKEYSGNIEYSTRTLRGGASTGLGVVGIKFVQSIAGGAVEIVQIYKNSPAELSGLRVNDKLLAIDGHPIGKINIKQVQKKVIGIPGTPVTLTVKRGPEIFSVELERADIDMVGNPEYRQMLRTSLRTDVYSLLGLYGTRSKKGTPETPEFKAWTLNTQASQLAMKGDYEASEEKLKEAAQLDPFNIDYLINLARIMVLNDQQDEAIDIAKKAIATAPESSPAWSILAASKEAVGDIEGAFEAYQKVEKLDSHKELTETAKKRIAILNDMIKSSSPEFMESDDYLDGILHVANCQRWRRSPINVFIEDGSTYPLYKPQYKQIMQDSFREWEKALAPTVAIAFTDDKSQANIICEWTNSSAKVGEEKLGVTLPYPYKDRLVQARIIMLLMPPSKNSGERLRSVALHEIGHALGLNGHSPHMNDIMYPVEIKHLQKLSERDAKTVQRLYSGMELVQRPELKPLDTKDAEQTDPVLKDVNEGIEEIGKHNMGAAIAKFHDALKVDPNHPYALDCMCRVYGNVAIQQVQASKIKSSETYFDEAMKYCQKTDPETLRTVVRNYSIALNLSGHAKQSKEILSRLQVPSADSGTNEVGVIGVEINQDVSLTNALNHIPNVETIIRQVYPDSPAERAGFKRGDVIQTVNGQNAKPTALLELLSGSPSTTIKLGILRRGKQMELECTRVPLKDVQNLPAEQVQTMVF